MKEQINAVFVGQIKDTVQFCLVAVKAFNPETDAVDAGIAGLAEIRFPFIIEKIGRGMSGFAVE